MGPAVLPGAAGRSGHRKRRRSQSEVFMGRVY